MTIRKIDQATLTRNRIAQAIDGLIDLLDKLEGDPDFEATGDDEPYMSTGAAIWDTQGGQDDLELDHAYFDNRVPMTGGQAI